MAEFGNHFFPLPSCQRPDFLQRLGDFGRHVVLVVLGQHLARGEDAVGAERALGDHALAFAEQVGQQAAIDHGHASAVRSVTLKRTSWPSFFTLPCSTRPPRRKCRSGASLLLGELARRIEEDDVVVQRRQHQRRRDAQHAERAHQQPQAACAWASPLPLQPALGDLAAHLAAVDQRDERPGRPAPTKATT